MGVRELTLDGDAHYVSFDGVAHHFLSDDSFLCLRFHLPVALLLAGFKTLGGVAYGTDAKLEPSSKSHCHVQVRLRGALPSRVQLLEGCFSKERDE